MRPDARFHWRSVPGRTPDHHRMMPPGMGFVKPDWAFWHSFPDFLRVSGVEIAHLILDCCTQRTYTHPFVQRTICERARKAACVPSNGVQMHDASERWREVRRRTDVERIGIEPRKAARAQARGTQVRVPHVRRGSFVLRRPLRSRRRYPQTRRGIRTNSMSATLAAIVRLTCHSMSALRTRHGQWRWHVSAHPALTRRRALAPDREELTGSAPLALMDLVTACPAKDRAIHLCRPSEHSTFRVHRFTDGGGHDLERSHIRGSWYCWRQTRRQGVARVVRPSYVLAWLHARAGLPS